MAVDILQAHHGTTGTTEGEGEGAPEEGVILSLVSVRPVRQTIRITIYEDDPDAPDGPKRQRSELHEMRSLTEFGAISRAEIARDWNRYRVAMLRVAGDEVLTDDEAILADYALERLIRMALPTVSASDFAGIESADKQGLASLFFNLTAANETVRAAATRSRSRR